MGTWMRFYSKECAYEAHVTSGNDVGIAPLLPPPFVTTIVER